MQDGNRRSCRWKAHDEQFAANFHGQNPAATRRATMQDGIGDHAGGKPMTNSSLQISTVGIPASPPPSLWQDNSGICSRAGRAVNGRHPATDYRYNISRCRFSGTGFRPPDNRSGDGAVGGMSRRSRRPQQNTKREPDFHPTPFSSLSSAAPPPRRSGVPAFRRVRGPYFSAGASVAGCASVAAEESAADS